MSGFAQFPSTLPAGTINVAYNQTITASGGTGPYAGGDQCHQCHRRSDRAEQRHEHAGHHRHADGHRHGNLHGHGHRLPRRHQPTDYTITVNPALTLSPGTLPADTINIAYNQTITASGGTGTITLAVTNIASAIPGLSPEQRHGSMTISGTPTATGTETFTVTATDRPAPRPPPTTALPSPIRLS